VAGILSVNPGVHRVCPSAYWHDPVVHRRVGLENILHEARMSERMFIGAIVVLAIILVALFINLLKGG
jgi:hypothetical protein